MGRKIVVEFEIAYPDLSFQKDIDLIEDILLKRPNEAITAFHFIADSIQLSILKDRAQFRIAEICQTILNNKAQAIEAYEKLTGKEFRR